MKYAVVIPSLASETTKPYLKLCVESLRASGFDGQIVVVTNGSTSKPDLKDIKGISVHFHTSAQGQCIATNIGAQAVSSDTDYLLISNDDMYYAPGWAKSLRFDHPVFSPNLVEPINNAGSASPFLKFDGGLTLEEFDEPRVAVEINQKIALWGRHGTEIGFNFPLFIEKDFWEKLKGYDVAYDPWGSNSDTDLQTRINLAGVTPMRLRDVLVYHFSSKSGTFDGTHHDFYMNNIEYFRDKFGFDRDELGSDVWYNKNMIPKDASKIKLKVPKYDFNNPQ